jgi:hypothetical protein
MTAPNPRRQREALQRLGELCSDGARCFTIHYACQSLFQGERLGSPRVAAIAARNVASGEAFSFSIATEAELQRLTPIQILSRLDDLERRLLTAYFEFLEVNRAMRFMHWNMGDQKFGFTAIEHRARLLGIEPFAIPESNRLDLAKLLVDIYGRGYAGRQPREQLASRNNLPLQGFLSGAEEADRFERGDYRAVLNSTLVKVRLYGDIAQLACDRTLKTRAGWWTMNVGRIREAAELFRDNPVWAIASIAGTAFVVVVKLLDLIGF